MPIAAADALVLVDIQTDFCAGGALAVPDGDAVVGPSNTLMAAAPFGVVVATQDWHPPGHTSFATSHAGKQPFDRIAMPYGEQTLWPDHCVQGTAGAAFHPDLDLDRVEMVVRKGFRADVDSYSAFQENDRKTFTGLAGYLRERGVKRVFLTGLAADVCVFFSAIDARAAGFETVFVEDAVRAIDPETGMAEARSEMSAAGVTLTTSGAALA